MEEFMQQVKMAVESHMAATADVDGDKITITTDEMTVVLTAVEE